MARHLVQKSPLVSLRKVKGHQDMNGGLGSDARNLVVGSTAADWWAKQGANIHDAAPAEVHSRTHKSNSTACA
eukprot:9206489-Pyramimonas_sp.AAC.1